MENLKNSGNDDNKEPEFKSFATKRIILGIILTLVGLWIFGTLLGFFEKAPTVHVKKEYEAIKIKEEAEKRPAVEVQKPVEQAPEPVTAPKEIPEKPKRPVLTREDLMAKALEEKPRGVVFVEACIKPLDFELHQRFWGWRPNDILKITDNVNNFQLGVLEVTRRTAVTLAERLSRTGTSAAFDRNLENAMNWFMIKADRYWFPSPESKFSDGLEELKTYMEKLEKREATFYTRADNLIPLLASYEDLIGSCEENLVKTYEEDGSPVSFFKADDYFFYAKGVASAMKTILEAVQEDFRITVESRRGYEVLHHAIEACNQAVEVNPWIITNSSLSGILANHRANLASAMSNARFYLGVLIKTLST